MIVYSGRVFSVEVATKRFPDGRDHEVAVVRHPAAVVVIPIDRDGRVILIRQFRAALDRQLWEMPAGSVDRGEPAEVAAARECEEEIGLAPRRVKRIGSFYPTPGYCDEEMIFFVASELEQPAADSPHRPDEDEDIEPRAFAVADARAMVARGEIVDLKTAYALTLL